jgi:hypothetical protein
MYIGIKPEALYVDPLTEEVLEWINSTVRAADVHEKFHDL